MTAPHALKSPTPTAGGARPCEQTILLHDMMLECRIGVSDRERATAQRLRLNLEIDLDAARPLLDELSEVVDYGQIAREIREICKTAGVRLLETLAGQIADTCFVNERITQVRVKLEKLDRYDDIDGIGVEIAFRPGTR